MTLVDRIDRRLNRRNARFHREMAERRGLARLWSLIRFVLYYSVVTLLAVLVAVGTVVTFGLILVAFFCDSREKREPRRYAPFPVDISIDRDGFAWINDEHGLRPYVPGDEYVTRD